MNWLHFHNPYGLRLSIRKYAMEAYPDLGQFLALRGKKIRLPEALGEVLGRTKVFSEELVTIRVSSGIMQLTGTSECGEHSEEREIKYTGDPLSFGVPVKLMSDVIERNKTCEVSDCTVRVDGGKWVFVASLGA